MAITTMDSSRRRRRRLLRTGPEPSGKSPGSVLATAAAGGTLAELLEHGQQHQPAGSRAPGDPGEVPGRSGTSGSVIADPGSVEAKVLI